MVEQFKLDVRDEIIKTIGCGIWTLQKHPSFYRLDTIALSARAIHHQRQSMIQLFRGSHFGCKTRGVLMVTSFVHCFCRSFATIQSTRRFSTIDVSIREAGGRTLINPWMQMLHVILILFIENGG